MHACVRSADAASFDASALRRSLDEAISVLNANPFGNGAALFTRSGAAARRFQHDVEAGQVGINVPIPVALPFFSFSGWRASFGGDLHFYGKQGVQFFTRTKTVTAAWRAEDLSAGSRTDTAFPTPGRPAAAA